MPYLYVQVESNKSLYLMIVKILLICVLIGNPIHKKVNKRTCKKKRKKTGKIFVIGFKYMCIRFPTRRYITTRNIKIVSAQITLFRRYQCRRFDSNIPEEQLN